MEIDRFTQLDTIIQHTIDVSVEPSKYGLDCFVSSEVAYNEVIAKCLPTKAEIGRAYLGVGPCQNYHYIAVFRPELALILDARLDNLLEHLLFKFCFQWAENPLEYLCLLFSRDLSKTRAASTVRSAHDLIERFEACSPSSSSFEANWQRIKDEMQQRWKLKAVHLARLERIYSEFFRRQLEITSVSEECLVNLDKIPTFREVLLASSSQGFNCHFLTSMERFEYVKRLHELDRIIPLQGNVTSKESVEEVNAILHQERLSLKNIYLSNMEEFLLERYIIEDNRITHRPNPNGSLIGTHKIAYDKLVEALGQLETDPHCALIRFYFPGEYQRRNIGNFPWLESHVTSLQKFLTTYKLQTPQSVFETYGF